MIILKNNVQDIGISTDIATETDTDIDVDHLHRHGHGHFTWTTLTDNLQKYKSIESDKLYIYI